MERAVRTIHDSRVLSLAGAMARISFCFALISLLATGPGAAQQALQAGTSGDPGDRPVVLVTGSTDGLGREVALRLGRTGAHVIVHGRNVERGQAVVEEIEREGRGSARFYAADFAAVEEVRRFAEKIMEEYDRLDVLVNNAGIWLNGDRQVSRDGHELHFAVNYLSGYLLTRQLLPLLLETPDARIVNVASSAQTPLQFNDVMLRRDYSSSRAYGQSKLAQILFTLTLAEEVAGSGLRVNALHPATLMDTNLVLDIGVEPRSSVNEGADAVMHLITSDEVGSGEYYSGLRAAPAHEQAYDLEARDRLDRLSRALGGIL